MATVTPVGTRLKIAGRIWQISPVIDPDTRQGTVRIALPYNEALRPGGFATASIEGGEGNVPLLPESAVMSDAKGNFVYIVGPDSKATREEEGAADARFHLAIAEASHNAVLLHTIRGLFDLLKHNVVTNIGGMYLQRGETREMLTRQHRALYEAIIERRAEAAREISHQHIQYVQEVLEESQLEAQRLARAQRRQRL